MIFGEWSPSECFNRKKHQEALYFWKVNTINKMKVHQFSNRDNLLIVFSMTNALEVMQYTKNQI